MLTLLEILLIGAAAILALLGVVEAVARIGAHKSFVATVILGEDNRTSTSKTFILMWTLLVGWALGTLLLAGEIISVHSCATKPVVSTAITACTRTKDQVGLLQIGWHSFLSAGLSGAYLLLLGIPAVAGVAAKAITQSKADAGTIVKTTDSGKQTASSRIAQIFSADDQSTDIGDFQYMIFNLVTAVYFVAEFVRPSTQGLPPIPDTLLGLTSVSAALYVGRKAAARSRPTITGVFPSILRAGQTVTVIGNGLTAEARQPLIAPAASNLPLVAINGVAVPVGDVTVDQTVPDRLTIKVPASLIAAGAQTPVSGTIQVLSSYGALTPAFDVQLA